MTLSEPQLYRRPPLGAAARARTPPRCAFTVRTSRPSFVLQTLHVDDGFMRKLYFKLHVGCNVGRGSAALGTEQVIVLCKYGPRLEQNLDGESGGREK